MLALDQFVLWVNAESPYKTAQEYIAAVKAGADKQFKMAGTGVKQEDQIITAALERLTVPKKFTYVPFKGGGDVAVQLVGKHVDFDRQQPDRGGGAMACRQAAAAVHLRRQAQHVHQEGDGHDGLVRHPDLQGSGGEHRVPDAARHLHAVGVTADQVEYYVDLFKKVMATPEWQEFMEQGAFNQTFMAGAEYRKWVEGNEKLHYDLMKEAGFLAPGK